MKINVTEQTTTFPVHLTGLKEALENEPNLIWKTRFGKIALCPELTKWIVTNAIESRYNSSRSYVYNKALWEAFTKINSLESLIKHADKFKPGTTEKVNHQLTDLGINHFDLNKVIEKNKDNSVFYCQYAYARASSVINKAEDLGIDIKSFNRKNS